MRIGWISRPRRHDVFVNDLLNREGAFRNIIKGDERKRTRFPGPVAGGTVPKDYRCNIISKRDLLFCITCRKDDYKDDEQTLTGFFHPVSGYALANY